MAKKFFDLFINRTIENLLRWQNNNKKRAFFIVICNKNNTHVAYKNIEKLTIDAATIIGCDPELEAAWESIGVGVDFFSQDMAKDPKWLEAANKLPHDTTSWRWKCYDCKNNVTGEYKSSPEK